MARVVGRLKLESLLLLMSGLIFIGVGAFFLLFRPPFLPEDLRFIGASSAEVQSHYPQLGVWLSFVFRVLGGYIACTGVLTSYLSITSFQLGQLGAGLATFASGLLSIGLMAATNFQIESDFKWLLAAFAGLWLVSQVLFFGRYLLILRGQRP